MVRYTFFFYPLCTDHVLITCRLYLFCCSFIFTFNNYFKSKKLFTKISKIIELKNNYFIINNYLNLKYND